MCDELPSHEDCENQGPAARATLTALQILVDLMKIATWNFHQGFLGNAREL